MFAKETYMQRRALLKKMKTKKLSLVMSCLSTQSYGWDHSRRCTKNANV